MSTRTFGARIERNIDPKLLKGEGAFVDDIPLSGALHAAFTRSVHARARIRTIDVGAARKHPGIVAVFTCNDIGDLDIEMPLLIPHPSMKHPRTQRPLTRDQVYYVGQTIAMVVAVDRYAAEDAAGLIAVDYEPLDVEIDIERSRTRRRAPLVHLEVPNNIAAHFVQVSGNPDDAFAKGAHHQDQGAGRPLNRRPNGVPCGRGHMGRSLGRTHRVGWHPGGL